MHTAGANIQSGKGTLHRRSTELARLSTQPAFSLRPPNLRIWPVISIMSVYSTFTLFERIPTLTDVHQDRKSDLELLVSRTLWTVPIALLKRHAALIGFQAGFSYCNDKRQEDGSD
jgi:hypothetical protein